jgi:hypothetical protein
VPLSNVELVRGTDDDFAAVAGIENSPGYTYRELPDGSAYFRWSSLFEFRTSADGSRIACRALDGCDAAVLQNFLVGQALSFALARQGIESWHAAVVGVGDCAIGFLGDCTYGKSTLLASFLHAGYRVLTDDFLVIDFRTGFPLAIPGSGRIKLMPDSAAAFLRDASDGTLLNPHTSKRSFRIDESCFQGTALPLKQLFILPSPVEREQADALEIRPLSRAMMVRALIKNSFNTAALDRQRLARQFLCATEIASSVDGFALRYRPGLPHVSEIRERILDHVHRGTTHGGRTAAWSGRYQS